jgi:hypothetical protein
MDHDQADIDSSAMALWYEVFRSQVLAGPVTMLRLGNLASTDEAAPPPETAQQCVDRAAALADAAEAKVRERWARKPAS